MGQTWGRFPLWGQEGGIADLNGDCEVNGGDFGFVLAEWGWVDPTDGSAISLRSSMGERDTGDAIEVATRRARSALSPSARSRTLRRLGELRQAAEDHERAQGGAFTAIRPTH